MIASSIPDVLRERASLQPNDIAFTFVDYDHDWEGVEKSLTWAQLYRRTVNLAQELRAGAAAGDRAVIIAPQGLDYLVAFLACLEAGVIGVPLSTPIPGQHDERVNAVMLDSAPSVVLTTTSVADAVTGYAQSPELAVTPTVIQVDLLDLDTRRRAMRITNRPEVAYLQYTSGSTRTPAGVMVTHANLAANFEQQVAAYFHDHGGVAPEGTTVASWLPFYHDMGLLLGVIAPVFGGWRTTFTTPLSFLARPARWMQLLAKLPLALTAGPNFAFELAAGRTSDADMEGVDLGNVLAVISGSERVHDATLKRFAQRFARFNLRPEALRPSYGLAEAVLYVATDRPGRPPKVVHFEPERLSAGHAEASGDESGTPLVGYGTPDSPSVRIIDPEARRELPAGAVGEIWVRGDNVCPGYWEKPEQSNHTFGGIIADPSAGTAEGPWLRTGDLGFISDDDLFIVGRIKDLLIVRGVNHYPDDIEATVQEITAGRVAAISVDKDRAEQLVVIVEVKTRGDDDEAREKLVDLKNRVAGAISQTHALSALDIVLVGRGAIPITTSGKIRRASCVQLYQGGQFDRLDAAAGVPSGAPLS
jgi:acyl-CoA synthetase (AMP-forming)/AMP-acid ligase II